MAQRMTAVRHGAVTIVGWTLVGLVALSVGFLAQRSPFLVLALVGVAGVGWLVVKRDLRLLVPLAMLTLAWGSSQLPGGAASFTAKFALIGAVGAAGIFSLAIRRDEDQLPVPTSFALAFLALLFVAVLSAGWSVDASGTLQKGASMLLVWGATALAVPMWARDEDDVRGLLVACGLAAALFTLAGVVLGVAGVVVGFRDYGRFNGLLTDANGLGYWIAPILPALVLMAARTSPGGRRRVLVFSIVTLTLGIAMSGSRGGAIAATVGVIVAFIAAGLTGEARIARRAVTLAVVALIVVAVVLPLLGVETRSGVGSTEGFFEVGTGSNRVPAWQTAIHVANQQPFFGHGFGMTPVVFPAEQTLSSQQAQILGRTHNSFLEVAIDLGWSGFVGLVALGLSGVVAAWRVARTPGRYQALGTILLAGVVGGLAEGMFESGLLAAGGLLAFPFWMVVGLAHSVRLAQRVERQRPEIAAV